MTVPRDVLDAFGAQGDATLLPGGEGRTYRVGEIVVRREHAAELADAEFAAQLFDSVQVSPDFRVPRPVATRDGGWLASGAWTAWTFVEGRQAGPEDAPAMARAIEAFHRSIAHVPCPLYLRKRTLVYDRADRGAFGDLPDDVDGRVRPTLEALYALRRPLRGLVDQVIHGDANGANVLVAPGLAPAIIDFAPYWRPPEFALAVAALWMCGFHGHVSAFPAFEGAREFDQFLLRALIRDLLVMDYSQGGGHLAEYDQSIRIVRQRLSS